MIYVFFKSGLEANAGWLAAIRLQSSAFEHMVEKTRDPLLISFPRSQLSRYFSPCMVWRAK